jgi:hypothetical protein
MEASWPDQFRAFRVSLPSADDDPTAFDYVAILSFVSGQFDRDIAIEHQPRLLGLWVLT